MNIEESVTKNQVDSDTKSVKKTIDEIVELAGHKGRRHHPIVLVAPMGNRVEFMQIIREVGIRCEVGNLRVLVTHEELHTKVFGDRNADSAAFVHGERLTRTQQKKIIEQWGDDRSRFNSPAIFLVLTAESPKVLCSRKGAPWSREFANFFGARIVTVRTAKERSVDDLLDLFRSSVRRAAMRRQVRFDIQRGAIDMLRGRWAMQRPASLDLIVAAAEKAVDDAHINLTRIAAEVVSKQPLVITGRGVLDAFMPDTAEIGAADRAMRQKEELKLERENMN